jgi:hypothetical protein
MKRMTLLIASLLLWSSISWAAAPPVPAPGTAPDKAQAAPGADDLWSAIFQIPASQKVATATCSTQTLCPSGLYLGCYGYAGPRACQTYRYCVMCDGVVYHCASGGFCPL